MEIALLFTTFFVLLFAGVGVGVSMLTASIINVTVFGFPPTIVAERTLNTLNSFTLLAVPFFILSGVIMNRGGLTARMVDVSKAFVGHFRGGTAHVNVVANMILSGVSGSASADCAAIGSMLIPTMKREGYPAGFAAGLTAAASCMGPIIPPSIVMVIYGSMTNLSIGRLFLGGAVPGVMIGLACMAVVWWKARTLGFPRHERLPMRQRGRVIFGAIPALLAPGIIIGGIVSGYYTATEAGVAACVYGLFVGVFIYRELGWKDIKPILSEAVEMTAIPMFLFTAGGVFGWLLTIYDFGPLMVDWMKNFSFSQTVMLVVVCLLLLAAGIVIDGLAALLIFVPVFMPLVPAYGIDPIHFALLVIIMIMIGTITPPIGMQIYISSAIAKVSLSEMTCWPFVWAMMVVVALIILFPPLVTFLPNLVFGVAPVP
jgi:tripartite ATP-independent transporter DctM subunit